MGHQPRWIPQDHPLVEVTTRTFQGRYLLRPTPRVRQLVLGVVGRAQRMHGMKICLLVFMSNHYHMLLIPRDAEQLASFMNFVNGEIAKEINRLSGWGGKVWGRRFDPILVANEPSAQRARFRYLLSHGVKEGLVERPWQWVGAHGVGAWLRGEPLRGYWFDRDRETRARRRAKARGLPIDPMAFATEETVELCPLPCWAREGLDLETIRREIRAMVDEVVELAELERGLGGPRPMPPIGRLLARPWDFRPEAVKRSPRPRFHYRSRRALEELREGLGLFLEAYRRASKRLRAGERRVRFPERCFPPAGPFTGSGWAGVET